MEGFSIGELVQTVIDESVKMTADSTISAKNNGYIKFLQLSQKLIQQYDGYKGSMSEYNEYSKQKSKLKRQLSKYSAQSDIGQSLSAKLNEIRQRQQEMREKNNLMEQARVSLVGIYKTVFALQNVVNRIQGQSIHMVYTSTRGGMTSIVLTPKDFPDGNMFGVDVDRYGQFVLRYNVSEIEQVVQGLKKQQDQDKIITSSIQPKLEVLYSEIIKRQEVAKSKNSQYLFWQVGKTWKKIKLINAGDLIEAYTNALLTGESDQNLLDALNGSIDEQIDALMTGYVSKVTNKSGFFEEDVNAENGQFYGVKSAGASLMGLALIVRLARVTTDSVKNGQMDQKAIASLQRAFNRSTVRNKVEEVCENEINDVVKTFGDMFQLP